MIRKPPWKPFAGRQPGSAEVTYRFAFDAAHTLTAGCQSRPVAARTRKPRFRRTP